MVVGAESWVFVEVIGADVFIKGSCMRLLLSFLGTPDIGVRAPWLLWSLGDGRLCFSGVWLEQPF